MIRALGLALALLGPGAMRVQSQAPGRQPLGESSAWVLPARDVMLTAFSSSRAGLGHDLELSSKLLLFPVLPQAALKWRALEHGRWQVAGRFQLTYPSLFMSAIAREGAGGLMPADSEPAQALMFDSRLLLTHQLPDWGWASASAGIELAARDPDAGSQDLLAFPFLYPRFAALDGLYVYRLDLGWEGLAGRYFGYGAEVTFFGIEAVAGGYALELACSGSWIASGTLSFDLGLRATRWRAPLGTRWHLLPVLDMRVAL